MTFRCGHARSEPNTLHCYGRTRCRTCHRAANRRSMRKTRAEFVTKHGSASAITD